MHIRIRKKRRYTFNWNKKSEAFEDQDIRKSLPNNQLISTYYVVALVISVRQSTVPDHRIGIARNSLYLLRPF